MERGHQLVITIGLSAITLVLVSLYLSTDRSEPAQIQEAVGNTSATPVASTTTDTPTAVAVKVSPSPVTKTMVTTEVTMMVTQVSSRVSPSLSPSSPPVSPRLSPTATTSSTPTPTEVQTPAKIIISEVGWMGTDASAQDEWLELYNAGPQAVDLAGWTLISTTDGSPNLKLKGEIPAFSFYLIERTKDDTISDLSANLVASFGTGGLNNEGEVLELRNPQGDVVDTAGAPGKWLAGTSAPRASMERTSVISDGKDASAWVTNGGSVTQGKDRDGQAIRGTPGGKNSVW